MCTIVNLRCEFVSRSRYKLLTAVVYRVSAQLFLLFSFLKLVNDRRNIHNLLGWYVFEHAANAGTSFSSYVCLFAASSENVICFAGLLLWSVWSCFVSAVSLWWLISYYLADWPDWWPVVHPCNVATQIVQHPGQLVQFSRQHAGMLGYRSAEPSAGFCGLAQLYDPAVCNYSRTSRRAPIHIFPVRNSKAMCGLSTLKQNRCQPEH